MRTLGLVLSAIATLIAGCEEGTSGALDAEAALPPAPTSGYADPRSGAPPTEPDEGDGVVPDVARRTALRPTTMTVTAETLDVAGVPREYLLATPNGHDATESYPLVLVLHPDAMDAASMRAAARFETISWQRAIVAYPTGMHGTWNLYEPTDKNPDDAFLLKLVDSLSSRLAIDPARVFGIGVSSGAFMLSQLACRRPSLFRAIAPNAGGAPYEPIDPAAGRWENGYVRCAGQTLGSGPAVMVVHGTADDVVDFASGEFTARYWAYINGCQPTRSAPASPPPCARHDGCPAQRPVVFCPIQNLGHALWADATRAAWEFFLSL